MIAAGKKDEMHGRPNMLLPNYLDEIERINQVYYSKLNLNIHQGTKFWQNI